MDLQTVTTVLRSVRPKPGLSEAQIHAQIAVAFAKRGLAYRHEVILTSGCRIDFVVEDADGGAAIGVEVKRGKPVRQAVARQLERYAATGMLAGVVLCMDRAVLPVDDEIAIPFEFVSFNVARGIAT